MMRVRKDNVKWIVFVFMLFHFSLASGFIVGEKSIIKKIDEIVQAEADYNAIP